MRLKGGAKSFDGVVFDVERDLTGGMVPDNAIEKLWQKIPFGPRVVKENGGDRKRRGQSIP